MRIAIVHSYYRSHVPSGENAVVDLQVSMLRDRGHDVHLVARRSDEGFSSPISAVRGAFTVASGRGPSATEELRAFQPDVVHVHNLFPGFGTSWLRSVKVPYVATLHNFRPLCANGLLFRDGHMCKECLEGSLRHALSYGCYRGSRVATAPLVVAQLGGLKRNPVLSGAARVICLSEESADIYRQWGLSDKVEVIPNGVPATTSELQPRNPSDTWLGAGRMTSEKGFLRLMDEWPVDVPLDLFGIGPELRQVELAAPPSVSVRGEVSRDFLTTSMSRYVGLVLPSLCIDTQPTVVSEALAAGLPVIAREGTASARVVATAGAGLSFFDSSSLESALAQIMEARATYSARARQLFSERFTLDKWGDALEGVYSGALGSQ